jgi:GT2 family glycosyltransferase
MWSAGGYSGEINTIRMTGAVRSRVRSPASAAPETNVPQTRRNLRAQGSDRSPITLAVVTRDRADSFARYLLAGLEQIAASAPVVVVDQSSDDATARLVEGRPGIRYLRSDPGLAHGRNVAVRETTTPLLAFTDDDVTLPASWLERMARAFEQAPDAGAVCGWAVTAAGVLQPGAAAGTYRWPAIPFALGSGFNIAFRREALEQVGTFDEELGAGARYRAGEDSDMLYRLLRAGWSVVCSDEITVVHHDRREGGEQLRLHRGYGVGAGAQTAKHHAAGDREAARLALRHAGRHLFTLARAAATLRLRLALIQVVYLSGLVSGYVRRRLAS